MVPASSSGRLRDRPLLASNPSPSGSSRASCFLIQGGLRSALRSHCTSHRRTDSRLPNLVFRPLMASSKKYLLPGTQRAVREENLLFRQSPLVPLRCVRITFCEKTNYGQISLTIVVSLLLLWKHLVDSALLYGLPLGFLLFGYFWLSTERILVTSFQIVDDFSSSSKLIASRASNNTSRNVPVEGLAFFLTIAYIFLIFGHISSPRMIFTISS